MDRCVDCEVAMEGGTCSYSCEVEGPESLGNAATRHALDQSSLYFLSAFIALLSNTIVFGLQLGNKGEPITLWIYLEYDRNY